MSAKPCNSFTKHAFPQKKRTEQKGEEGNHCKILGKKKKAKYNITWYILQIGVNKAVLAIPKSPIRNIRVEPSSTQDRSLHPVSMTEVHSFPSSIYFGR